MRADQAGSWLADRYRLSRPIGAGGMGQVWLARDEVLGRDVAVKVLSSRLEAEPAAFERFVREARTAAALSHPNVVTVFDSGIDEGAAFLVMELLPGPTLTDYLAERGPLPEPEAVSLAAQVASGLAAAHAAGVVHRDVKPANLVFDARGQLVVVDFGIARLASAATLLTTADGIIGSPPYLSPEQLEGRPADERSDLYALGGVLMTMLTGRAPFEGTHPLALLQQHLHADPPQVADRRPGVDPALNALVAALLSKSPEDRPQSAREVVAHLTGTPLQRPAPTSAAADLDTTQRLTAAPARRARTGRPPSTPSRWFVAGGAVLALVAAVIIAGIPTADTPTAGSVAPTRTTATTPTAAESSRTRSARPTPTRATPESRSPEASRSPEPSRSPSTARTKKARTPARTAEPEVTDAGDRMTSAADQPRAADAALAGLRSAVTRVWDSGQIEAKKAVELSKRVEELAKHLERAGGPEPAKKVDELGRYVEKLAGKGELTPAGQRQITQALEKVRVAATSG